MTCSELEILLADYLDGTLAGAGAVERKSAVETHLAGCAACAELARDAAGAMAFMERAAVVEAPRELTASILENLESSGAMVRPSWVRRWLQDRFRGSLEGRASQPRFAWGIAMAVVSFAMAGSMLGRVGLEVSRMNASVLAPAKVWTMAENGVYRSWDRAVKYYDNAPLVSEIQTQLTDLTGGPADAGDGPGAFEDSSAGAISQDPGAIIQEPVASPQGIDASPQEIK